MGEQAAASPRRKAIRWVALTALLAWALHSLMTLSFSSTVDAASFAGIVALVVAIVGAVLLRLYWPALRAWSHAMDGRFVAHPVLTVALFVLVGMIFGTGFGSLGFVVFSGFLWGFMGWLNLRRRGPAAT
jgi:hypothetical protein